MKKRQIIQNVKRKIFFSFAKFLSLNHVKLVCVFVTSRSFLWNIYVTGVYLTGSSSFKSEIKFARQCQLLTDQLNISLILIQCFVCFAHLSIYLYSKLIEHWKCFISGSLNLSRSCMYVFGSQYVFKKHLLSSFLNGMIMFHHEERKCQKVNH